MPFPTPGHLPDSGIKAVSVFPALAGRLYTTAPPGKMVYVIILQNDYNELLQFQVERSLVRFTPRYFIPFAVTVNGFSSCL